MRKTVPLFAIVVALCCSARQAWADITIEGPIDANHVHTVTNAPEDDTCTLAPDPVTYLAGATNAMKGALAADFPGWTFTYATGLNGTLTINEYKAVLPADDWGRGSLDVTYTRVDSDPMIADLHWIQMITTNRPLPLGGSTSPYIDPRPNDDILPFYWTLAEDTNAGLGNKTDTTYHFFDTPQRDLSDGQPVHWRGELMLAYWTGEDPVNPWKVAVFDGIRWGWDAQSVPEPGSFTMVLSLVLMGASGVLLRQLRRRRQIA